MKVFVCVDNSGGMMFGGRRQSRDSAVISDIINECSGKLYIDEYSKLLFNEQKCNLEISSSPLNDAEKPDNCFIENHAILPFIDKISQLVVYCWNRDYPADLFLDVNPKQHGFSIFSETEIMGSSHEKITKRIYNK